MLLDNFISSGSLVSISIKLSFNIDIKQAFIVPYDPLELLFIDKVNTI